MNVELSAKTVEILERVQDLHFSAASRTYDELNELKQDVDELLKEINKD